MKVDYDFAAEEFDDITAGCKDFIKKLLVRDPKWVMGGNCPSFFLDQCQGYGGIPFLFSGAIPYCSVSSKIKMGDHYRG